MKITAVAIKLNSVQEYIFHSNKLKENIGANHITSIELFKKTMINLLRNMFPNKNELKVDVLKSHCGSVQINGSGSKLKCEIGDIGGGGALVFFKEEKIINVKPKVDVFIEQFSREVLLKYPGLMLSFARLEDFNFQETKFKNSMKDLYINLGKNKNQSYSNTTIFKHGITADCPYSNESQEEYCHQEKKYLSNVSISKINQVENSNSELNSIISDTSYVFTEKVDKLGQEMESSYIAVVHIDGNGMSKRFNEAESLPELRKLSYDVQKIAKEAMKKLINENVIGNIPELKDENGNNVGDERSICGIKLQRDGKNYILPIRPILGGGDDITFVCEGRLGIYLAEKFVKHFTMDSNVIKGACAGIAIVKTKFPFYKAYLLAEELCHEAKQKSRIEPGSYISYYYSATTFSGSLKKLRERVHKIKKNNLYFGPYRIDGSLNKLKDGIAHFNNKEVFPKNKVMKLREVLIESDSAQQLFLKEINEAGIKLPEEANELWKNTEREEQSGMFTPFFDQIELMDFYPKELI